MESLQGGSCFQRKPQEELLHAFQYRKLKVFEGIVRSGAVDLAYEYPGKGRILEIVCSSQGNNTAYIQTLLDNGADPNSINCVSSKGPIHSLASANKAESLAALLDCKETNINLKDELGKTALHYAMENESDCLKKLLEYRNLDVNFPDIQDRTPIHCAIDASRQKNIQLLLDEFRDSLDLDSVQDCNTEMTPRQAIMSKYKDIDLPEPRPQTGNIFQVLRNSEPHEMDFSQFQSSLDENDGYHTPLQYAADYGFSKAVEDLLILGANPQIVHPSNQNTPLMIAASRGYVTIVQLLCSSSKTKLDYVHGSTNETVLHKVVNGSGSRPTPGGSDEDIDHTACLQIILNYGKEYSGFMIDQQDSNGNTALMCSALQGNDEMCLMLLQYGAFACKTNRRGVSPISLISPKVLEELFDGCITANKSYLPREDNFEIRFDYNFIAPKTNGEQYLEEDEQYSESHLPMMIACSKDTKHLLKHPIFRLFIQLKWEKIKKIFMINFILYAIFCLAFTLYVLEVLNTAASFDLTNWPSDKDPSEKLTPEQLKSLPTSFPFVVLVLTIILTVREVFQCIISPLKYIRNLDNWIEVILIIVTYIVIFSSSVKLARVCSSIGIILSWTELLLLIGRHPIQSTYSEMLKSVSASFIKLLLWYSLLIFGFSLSFCILFHDAEPNDQEPNFFATPGLAFFKSIVMLTGEFETNSVPFDQYNGLSHITFIVFVFLISIVLFNLLTGLAVSDIQVIKEEAKLVGYISEVKLISYYEDFLKNDSPVMRLVLRLQRAFYSCCQGRSRKAFERNLKLFEDRDDFVVSIFPNKENSIRLNTKQFGNASRLPEHLYGLVSAESIVLEAKGIMWEKYKEPQPGYVVQINSRMDKLAEQQKDLSQKLDQIVSLLQSRR